RRSLAVVFAAAVAITGCSSGPKLVKVEGKVFVDDAPVETGLTVTGYVVFHADSAKGNTNMEDTKADIGPDRTYRVYTRDKEGAPAGGSSATVALPGTTPTDPYDYNPIVRERYLDKTKSRLTFEVVANPEPGRYDIRLESIAKEKGKQ